jgi:hypothetical protein
MRSLILPALLALAFSANSQSIKKYSISNSGCTAFMYCDPGKWDVDLSEDSSKVYTAECSKDNVTYGIVLVKLLQPVPDLTAAEDVTISYLDYLKASVHIKTAAGYGKGHRLNNSESTRGILDYWKDADKNNWKIKAWTDGKFIAVLYAFSAADLSRDESELIPGRV